MKKLARFGMVVIAILALFASEQAKSQDTILLTQKTNTKVTLEAYVSFRDVGKLVLSSRVAYFEDAKELIEYNFGELGIKNSFWQNAAQRYADWPDDDEGEYDPKAIIYVPNNNYFKAIIFDWSSQSQLKIAIFSTDGLWTTQKSLSKKWRLFIDPDFIEIIDFNDNEEEW